MPTLGIDRSGYHAQSDIALAAQAAKTMKADIPTFKFINFFHPFVGDLTERLKAEETLSAFMDPVFLAGLATKDDSKLLGSFYEKIASEVEIYDLKVEFDNELPYANYNWELFYHIPVTVAVHLSNNQRFAEAQRWFHLIFDPTSNDKVAAPQQRYWRFLEFRQNLDRTSIDELLALLSKPDDPNNKTEQKLKEAVAKGYDEILSHPFQPHRVARCRPAQLAYRYYVVMKYLDNLIAWGDTLFRQDTVESLNEATQRYVLAANILGQRPQRIPRRAKPKAKNFRELRESIQCEDRLGNPLVDVAGSYLYNLSVAGPTQSKSESAEPLFGIGQILYFCIPRNEQLLGYWDKVADRLFKIRHCMNIEGAVRPLALFDPPIDPGILVKAAAAGIDISGIVRGTNQPPSPVRSLYFIQKALELAGEVRAMGSALLSAYEKGDGETLALLRQGHEIEIQEMQQEVRFLHWKSAQESTRSLLTSRKASLERLRYYQRLLGREADPNATSEIQIDFKGFELAEKGFDDALKALEGEYDKEIDAPELPALSLSTEDGASLKLTESEDEELTRLRRARDAGVSAALFHSLAGVLQPVVNPGSKFAYWGLGGSIDFKTGTVLSNVAKLYGDMFGIEAAYARDEAGLSSKTAGYERRSDEWQYQYNLAAHELMQSGRQILTSRIAEAIASHDYEIMKKQIAHSQEVDRFMRERKTSNEQLYLWMQGELTRLYGEYYGFAVDIARKAEETMKRELMRPELETQTFIKFNYWDYGRKGLLSGEALYLDIKRMEREYHESNKRELELTKHVSLRQLNPLALLGLRASGRCRVEIPEWLFDLDCPGHYMRRIKSVALSIPAVVGPYTNLSCTLTLLRSSLRKSPIVGEDNGYPRATGDDTRFVDYPGGTQTIVTSSGQNDSGLFETNLRDERFLPFEGAGAYSTWTLELPEDFRQFDYGAISDVVFHIRYTARSGGAILRSRAVEALAAQVADADRSGLAILLSLKQDFPSDWRKFINGKGPLEATLTREHFPYFTAGKELILLGAMVYFIHADVVVPGGDVTINQIPSQGAQRAFPERYVLQFTADSDALRRDDSAPAFVVVTYAIEGK